MPQAEGAQSVNAEQNASTNKQPPKPGAQSDPLHGVTLEKMLERMVQRYGWAEMADRIPIRCFQIDPSIKSSLTFLRKTPGLARNWKTGTPTPLDALTWRPMDEHSCLNMRVQGWTKWPLILPG